MHRMGVVYTTIVLMALLMAMLPRPASGAYAARYALHTRTASHRSVHVAPAGDVVRVPDIVAERLALPTHATVRAVAPATAHRIERFLHDAMPCRETMADELIILEQPALSLGQDDVLTRSGFLTGVSAVEKRDSALPYSHANLIVKLYLFLPSALLGGTGIDHPLSSQSVIPYAAAPVPTTYGEFLDWTLAHETWHLIDIHARLDKLRDQSQDSYELLDVALNDPSLWAKTFPWAGLSTQLGMADSGNSYASSDELDRTYALIRGATHYQHQHGAFTVRYDDGSYAFERGFTRTGYLPEEIQHLSDLAPLLKSGRFPTLYALFNTDNERFAEFGAWWWFAMKSGGASRFAQLFPSLDSLYMATWQKAARRCVPSSDDSQACLAPKA